MSTDDTSAKTSAELIHDWNGENDFIPPGRLMFQDETLRDGLQNPSVVDPPLGDKLELIELMDELGIHTVTVGLPGAGPRAVADSLALVQHVVENRLGILPACAARTIEADIRPIVEISQRSGIGVEVMAFIGSSPIRQYVENWDVQWILERTRSAIRFAVQHGLKVTYVTEDTTRSRPEVLSQLFQAAMEEGAHRLCLCDTVGHATPSGTRALIRFTKQLIDQHSPGVGIDWHGHNDRGLALINALTAVEAGADRIHGTALGIGERVGNTPMDLLLMNLKLEGAIRQDLTQLVHYARQTGRSTHVPVSRGYPLVGEDAFRTATGVHAAAVIKAARKGENDLADVIYSGVPAGLFGCKQIIEIGPMSGASNVTFWLVEHGYAPDEALVTALLTLAKRSDRVLTDDEVIHAIRLHRKHHGLE